MKKTYTTLTAIAVMTTSLASINTASAADGRAYIGGAIGASTLEPRVLTVNGRVTDDTDTAFKIYGGYDVGIKDYFYVEGFYADMGSASIDTGTRSGDIDYKLYGISAVYKRPFSARFKGLAKIGYADVKNDASNQITYRQVENGDIYLGVGAEFPINKNLNIRGEYEYFDDDIKLLSAGINYKF